MSDKPPRKLSAIDQLIMGVDHIVRTVSPGSMRAHRESPAAKLDNIEDDFETLSAQEKKHIGGLMRINHTGEVCAQALYQGQALTAKTEIIRDAMNESAKEEEDHLAWCEERLDQLQSKPSYLNPLFYGLSF